MEALCRRDGRRPSWTGLTASKSRKVAVTTIRESGADRQQQRILARHMAHNVSTADRYYDKSSLFKERRDVLKKLSSMYTIRMAVACVFFRFIIFLLQLILKLFFWHYIDLLFTFK